MKDRILLAVVSLMLAHGITGTASAQFLSGLAPVVIQVTDGKGVAVEGAIASIDSDDFERLPDSFPAEKYRSTDAFGAVLMHIPYQGIKGERVLRGALTVEKVGYTTEKVTLRKRQELSAGAKKYPIEMIEVELSGAAVEAEAITAADVFKHLEEGKGMFDDAENLKQKQNYTHMGATMPSAEDAIPRIVRLWLSPQSPRVVEMCWWRQEDRGARLMILALHYTSRGDTDISFFTQFDQHTDRFTNREALERAEEVKLVTENREVFAAALQRFYKRHIAEDFEIYRGESVDHIAKDFDGDLDVELKRLALTETGGS